MNACNGALLYFQFQSGYDGQFNFAHIVEAGSRASGYFDG